MLCLFAKQECQNTRIDTMALLSPQIDLAIIARTVDAQPSLKLVGAVAVRLGREC